MPSQDHQTRIPGTPCIHCGTATICNPGMLTPSPQTICLTCHFNPWESVPVQIYEHSLSTLPTTLTRPTISRTPAPRVPPSLVEVTNSQHIQALQEAKNGRVGAIVSAKKESLGSRLSSFSQNSEKAALQKYQFFFRISNGWADLAGEGESGWSCWLSVNLDEVADNSTLDSPFFRLQPIQRLLVQIVKGWPGWRKYCEEHEVTMDIHNPDSQGIAFLVGGGGGQVGKGVKSKLSAITWPGPPNQYTTLRQLFTDYAIRQQVTLGISVTKAQFISRNSLTQVKKEPSLPPARLSPEVKIKTEPVFELSKRTTALASTVEFIDLTSDSSDDSLPELSEVLLQAKPEGEVVIKLESSAHKRGGSLSTYQPLSTTKRSKSRQPTKSTRSAMSSRGSEPILQVAKEIGEGEGEGEGRGRGGQATLGLWEEFDRLGEQSEGEQSEGEQSEGEQSEGEQSKGEQSKGEQSEGEQSEGEQSKGEQSRSSKRKSGRRVQLPQRFTN